MARLDLRVKRRGAHPAAGKRGHRPVTRQCILEVQQAKTMRTPFEIRQQHDVLGMIVPQSPSQTVVRVPFGYGQNGVPGCDIGIHIGLKARAQVRTIW